MHFGTSVGKPHQCNFASTGPGLAWLLVWLLGFFSCNYVLSNQCFVAACPPATQPWLEEPMLHTLQKQVGFYNNKMVTLVAIQMSHQLVCLHDQNVCTHTSWRDSGYEKFTLVWKTNCIRQPKRQLSSSSYNHSSYTDNPEHLWMSLSGSDICGNLQWSSRQISLLGNEVHQ